jgi:hypothetical protein
MFLSLSNHLQGRRQFESWQWVVNLENYLLLFDLLVQLLDVLQITKDLALNRVDYWHVVHHP